MEPLKSPSDLEKLRKNIIDQKDPEKPTIAICVSGCEALGALEVLKAFEEDEEIWEEVKKNVARVKELVFPVLGIDG